MSDELVSNSDNIKHVLRVGRILCTDTNTTHMSFATACLPICKTRCHATLKYALH